MPPGKRQQTNPWFIAGIVFVFLFALALVVAVVFYVQFDKQRIAAREAVSKLDEMANSAEQRKVPSVIGTIARGKSALGTMIDYLDQTIYLILGGAKEETSAEVKMGQVAQRSKDSFELVKKYVNFESDDPNGTGLLRIIEKLKLAMDNTTNENLAMKQQYQQLQDQFDDAMAASFEKEQTLLAEKEQYHQKVEQVAADYNDLQALLQQSSEQRVQTILVQLDELKNEKADNQKEMLRMQAQLNIAQNKIELFQSKLDRIVPQPEKAIAAFKPDGKVILIDKQNNIVHLSIGSKDQVYRGLAFTIYDKYMPIPKDGKGKAEVEVFDVEETISVAKIIPSVNNRPILLNDKVANLIWSSDKANVFVVAGDFDLDGNGSIDYDGVRKIKALIEKWGGKVAENISVETDFVLLGKQPRSLSEPTFEQREIDPMATEKYEASLKVLDYYNQVQNQAKMLSIPVFNQERFFYFIGYKTLSTRTGAF